MLNSSIIFVTSDHMLNLLKNKLQSNSNDNAGALGIALPIANHAVKNCSIHSCCNNLSNINVSRKK